VLARELTIAEIAALRKLTGVELEVFIHGGMCASYSGRCTLSNIMTGRDANRGGCAHSCRWEYDLYKNNQLFKDDFQIASKDLEALKFIPKLIDIGVDSFKIEGRMKSLHYIATVVRTYRRLIDDYLAKRKIDLDFYYKELSRAENRPFGPGLFEGSRVESQLYGTAQKEPSQEFVGMVLGYDLEAKEAIIEQRNHFRPHDRVEMISPAGDEVTFAVEWIKSESGVLLDAARHPLEIVRIPLARPVEAYSLLRKVSS
jgi:putative protease